MDSEIAGISALVAADAAAYMSAFNPSIFTIRTFRQAKLGASADETAADIRRGMVLGGILTVVTGFGGSAVTTSWWPFLTAMLTLAFLVAAYEWAIRNPRGQSDMTGAK
jgi:hypothetical protein